jgi:hypothetical protein
MSPTFSIIYMFLVSIPIGYITMPAILGIQSPFLRFHFNKIYGAILMAFFMAFAEMLMYLTHMKLSTTLFWVILLSGGIFSTYKILRKQMAIDEKQFLDGMIEHHGMAIVMSEKLIEKPEVSSETKYLADQILKTQLREIAIMDQLSKRVHHSGV